MSSVKQLLVSKFEFKYPPDRVKEIRLQLESPRSPKALPSVLRALGAARKVDAIFISNPQFIELVFVYLVSKLVRPKPPILFFDLIMRAPTSASDRLMARIKTTLLGAVDVFVFIHKDTRAYQSIFGIPPERCRYVPFKANNFDLAGQFPPAEGDYILSLGASHRDYKLLIEAVRGLDIPLKIVVPHSSIKKHNANILGVAMPPNVEHVSSSVDRLGWSRYIAESRFIVIPLLPDVIQPAGISVYLEAMVLGKAVIITRGASTEGILDDGLAVLVPQGDVPAMRQAIEALWHDAARRNRIAQASNSYALSLKDHARLVQDLRAIVARYIEP